MTIASCECRGLDPDAARDWQVVAYPFDRFFNLEEHKSRVRDDFDWSTAKLFPKLDGSLAILFWYRGQWRVASSRRPDATGLLGMREPEGGIVFEALFWEIWASRGYRLPEQTESRWCFMFELTSRRHPIVVRHSDDRLTLIGARNLDTMQEYDPAPIAARKGWESIREIERGADGSWTEERVLALTKGLDGSSEEGFVACDEHFRRVKVKSSDYVRLAWLFPLCSTRAQVSSRRLLTVVLAGEVDEFLVYCPEHRSAILDMEQRLDALQLEIDKTHERLLDIEDAARFAVEANRYVFADVLFMRRFRGLTTSEAIKCSSTKKLTRWLEARQGSR
ncbi:MAG: RNA ligase [Polyangiaceae bacterium]